MPVQPHAWASWTSSRVAGCAPRLFDRLIAGSDTLSDDERIDQAIALYLDGRPDEAVAAMRQMEAVGAATAEMRVYRA
jgi:hypothetical protein